MQKLIDDEDLHRHGMRDVRFPEIQPVPSIRVFTFGHQT